MIGLCTRDERDTAFLLIYSHISLWAREQSSLPNPDNTQDDNHLSISGLVDDTSFVNESMENML